MVIPPQAGPELLTTLQNEKVEISSAPSGNGSRTEVLIYLIVFGLPIVLFVWLSASCPGAAGGRRASCSARSAKATRSSPPHSPTWARRPGAFGAYVVTDEPDALYERARAAGAEIVSAPHDTDYGSRDFAARDPEGNRWSFGTYRGEPRKG